MYRFKVEELVLWLSAIAIIQGYNETERHFGRGSEPVSDQNHATLIEHLNFLGATCLAAGLHDAAAKVRQSLVSITDTRRRIDKSATAVELNNITDTVLRDCQRHAFLRVPPDRINYIDNDALFGGSVRDRFPSARFDILAAGNCLAADCATAAVFHLMRVVEHGLRAFAQHLGVLRMQSQTKSGKRHYTPISYSQWETILNGLPKRIERRLQKLRPGPVKQRWQEFYQPVLLDINAIREAWRNHVMHTRQEFNSNEAEGVKVRVEGIMRNLASKISEV